jgi:hypothetical protein
LVNDSCRYWVRVGERGFGTAKVDREQFGDDLVVDSFYNVEGPNDDNVGEDGLSVFRLDCASVVDLFVNT